jgi:hypothetical protein
MKQDAGTRLLRKAKRLLIVPPTTSESTSRHIKKWNEKRMKTQIQRIEQAAFHLTLWTSVAAVILK